MVGSALLRASSQKLAAALSHVVLLLHGSELLVLSEGEGERNTEEEGGGGDHPSTLAAERENAPGGVTNRAGLAGDPRAGGGGYDIAQGI